MTGQVGGPTPAGDKVLLARERAKHMRNHQAKRLARQHAKRVARQRAKRLARQHAKHRAKAKARPAPRPVAVSPHLQAIAACESGGNPRAIGGGGMYRGKYQFSYATWAAVGGQGDPAAAPEPEQDRRAAILYAQAGAGQWPVCGS